MTPTEMAQLHATCFTIPRPWSATEFVSLLSEPAVIVLTRPGGLLLGRAVADEAELLTLAVAHNVRRQGIARELVLAFTNESRARGAKSAFLEVAETNGPARALYAASGFTLVGRRSGYYRHPDGRVEDALVLIREL